MSRHGKIKCWECFGREVEWGHELVRDGWILKNNPCSWGSENPLIMILGFSKGRTQIKELESGKFNEVPFKGMRKRIDVILDRLGVLSQGESISDKINEEERDFSFGSLVRCSLLRIEGSTGLIELAFRREFPRRIIRTCVRRHLGELPSRLRLVLFFGNSDFYVDRCFELVKELYPDTKKLNGISYYDPLEDRTWVHVVHPSRASGKNFSNWVSGIGKQGMKMRMAKEAIMEKAPMVCSSSEASIFERSHLLEI